MTEAVSIDMEGVPALVFKAEYLAAIALQNGRAKDKARLLPFIESGVLNMKRFESILERHGLIERWKKFERDFLRSDT